MLVPLLRVVENGGSLLGKVSMPFRPYIPKSEHAYADKQQKQNIISRATHPRADPCEAGAGDDSRTTPCAGGWRVPFDAGGVGGPPSLLAIAFSFSIIK